VEQVRECLDQFQPRGKILELACDTGFYAQQLLGYAQQIAAIDAAPETLEWNGAWNQADGCPLIVHLDASLKTQVLNSASFELTKGVESFDLIGEQIETGVWVTSHFDPASTDKVIDPVRGNPELRCNLWDG